MLTSQEVTTILREYVYKAALRSVFSYFRRFKQAKQLRNSPSSLAVCPDVGALSQLVMSTLDQTTGITLPPLEGESEPTEEGINLHCFSTCLVQVPIQVLVFN